jgi:threonyl-tRNA synthetase
MLPHGVRIVNRLLEFLRAQYRAFGYHEVISPLLFNKSLWECSGHWDNYKEDMFLINQIEEYSGSEVTENLEMGLKPMNCPAHCLIYGSESHSYRDLPLRYADFSPLHRYLSKLNNLNRNEDTGALTGLTRVRKFHQDDGHIFCRPDQIESEIASTLEFLQRVYHILGFESIKTCLSTRPKKYMGNVEEWTNAENSLMAALEKRNMNFSINEGDGAFYGPKIDILVKDSFGRDHQTATIQLDFQLPERFNLSYITEKDTFERPVIIHRAVLGSIERMMAILLEHYQGKWPFWLSPRQAIVIAVRKEFNDYAVEVSKFLSSNGVYSGNIISDIPNQTTSDYYFVDVDISEKTFGKKVHDAQIHAYNYLIVVGEREYNSKSVTIRALGKEKKDGAQILSLKETLLYFTGILKKNE